MKAKKIIKDILGLGVVSGVAYLAYKIGEGNGEINERFRDKYGDDEENEDFNFYDYDEPDDGCITPADRGKPVCTMEDLKEMTSVEESSSEQKNNFAPLNSITTVPAKNIRNLLLYSISKKYISNKFIRDYLDVDHDKAVEILTEFQQAGYIGDETGNYRYPVNLAFYDLIELVRDSREN
jgi:hypothetical protein rflaF_20861